MVTEGGSIHQKNRVVTFFILQVVTLASPRPTAPSVFYKLISLNHNQVPITRPLLPTFSTRKLIQARHAVIPADGSSPPESVLQRKIVHLGNLIGIWMATACDICPMQRRTLCSSRTLENIQSPPGWDYVWCPLHQLASDTVCLVEIQLENHVVCTYMGWFTQMEC